MYPTNKLVIRPNGRSQQVDGNHPAKLLIHFRF
jgi:hypothetical protein